MAAYAFLDNIEYIYDECPFSKGAKSIYYKQLLNQLEHKQPGAKLQFFCLFCELRMKVCFPNRLTKA